MIVDSILRYHCSLNFPESEGFVVVVVSFLSIVFNCIMIVLERLRLSYKVRNLNSPTFFA